MLACWHRGGLSCLIILLGTLALLAFFSQASANFIPPYDHHIGIYIKADGSIEPASAPIHRLGEQFRMIGNATIGIAIERNNITFDGNGFYIQGIGGTGCLLNANGVIAQHLKLIGFEYGIYVNSSDCKVTDNTLTGGSSLRAGSANQITGNQITGNIVDRMIETYSNDTLISNNRAKQITLQGYNVTVSDNQIIKNERVDVRLLSQWDDRSGGAINIAAADSCNFINNTIMNQNVAINVWYSTNLVFSSNNLSNNQIGITISSSSLKQYMHRFDVTNTVNGKPVYYLVNQSNIKVPNNAGWAAAINCQNITVQDWSSMSNWDGVLFAFTKDSKIYNCTLNSNFNGIRLDNASNIRIIGNTIKDNGYAAFYLRSPTNSLISYNDIANNYCFVNMWKGTESNIFYYNNFVGSIVGGSSSYVTNMWDNGSKGNYWSTFENTFDQNNDGIVDATYVANANAGIVDYYPLVKPIDFSQTQISLDQTSPAYAPKSTAPITTLPTSKSPTTQTPTGSSATANNFQNQPTVEPTPIPEFSTLAILPLFITMLLVAVILRHRKTNILSQ